MWRVCGCCFVAKFNPRFINRAQVSWRSFYTIYFLVCGSILCTFRINIIYGTLKYTTADAHGAIFSSLYTFMAFVINAESMLVFFIMSLKSGAMLEFFRAATLFEKTLVVPRTYSSRMVCLLPRLFNGVFFVCISLRPFLTAILLLVGRYKLLGFSDILQTTYALIASVIYSCCDYGNAATIRAVGGVLVQYVRIQADALKQHQVIGLNLPALEDVGLKLISIKSLKEDINAILNPCIVLFSLRAFSVISISGYVLFRLGFTNYYSFFLSVYILYVAFGLIDIASISNVLEEEVGTRYSW
ncbi:hypothetical protein HPB48_019339 [Haemaphysalis longicornis]|uniref:Uncharacterized protein n=1 Tax=Haemaphysalis longicornis TaxID=44386 RepID=A0A9J6GR13_HAELO|nr:hypothetical protein HPB48_019339 [Haemaphysalis longicornis]